MVLESVGVMAGDIHIDLDNAQCLHAMFRVQADKTPNALALVDKDYKLTYKELDEATDRLAVTLVKNFGVQKDDSVGMLIDRC